MRKRLIVFENGDSAVLEGLTISGGSPIAEELLLDELPQEDFAELMTDRKAFAIEKDGDGNTVRLKKGKTVITLSPAPRTPPVKKGNSASNNPSPTERGDPA